MIGMTWNDDPLGGGAPPTVRFAGCARKLRTPCNSAPQMRLRTPCGGAGGAGGPLLPAGRACGAGRAAGLYHGAGNPCSFTKDFFRILSRIIARPHFVTC